MGPFEEYIACIIAFFIPFTYVIKEKKIFLCIWLLQHTMLCQRRWKIASLDTIAFLDTHLCIKNPYWRISGIIFFLRKYYIVISDNALGFVFLVAFLAGCVFLVSCCIIRTARKTKKEILSCRKKCIEEFIWRTSLFWLYIYLLMSFLSLFYLLPPHSEVTYFLNGAYKDT